MDFYGFFVAFRAQEGSSHLDGDCGSWVNPTLPNL